MSVLPAAASELRQAGGAVGRLPRYASAVVVALVVVAALFPAAVAPFGPDRMDPAAALQAPSLVHVFGTDENGRDVFSRLVHGARDSLLVGVVASGTGFVLGLLFGFTGGMGGRRTEWATTKFIEVMLAFPSMVLALLFLTLLGSGSTTTALAVGLSLFPAYARVVRSQVLRVGSADFVRAAVVLGRSRKFILLGHLLPNVVRPLLVLFTLGVGQAIVWGASLSYLGLGAAPPAPEWGLMLASGRNFISFAWWLTLFPGLAIVATTVAVTVLGHTLRNGEHPR